VPRSIYISCVSTSLNLSLDSRFHRTTHPWFKPSSFRSTSSLVYLISSTVCQAAASVLARRTAVFAPLFLIPLCWVLWKMTSKSLADSGRKFLVYPQATKPRFLQFGLTLSRWYDSYRILPVLKISCWTSLPDLHPIFKLRLPMQRLICQRFQKRNS
jgi:hypothetical protein